MSMKEALGLGSRKKIRHVLVRLGDISQEAIMPRVEHTGNSEVAALVTGDPEKAQELSKKSGVKQACDYELEPVPRKRAGRD